MKHNYTHIQNCHKLHDAAVAQTVALAYKALRSLLSFPEMNSAELKISTHINTGRHLHDQEIGRVIKDLFKASPQSLEPRSHVSHHAVH